MPEFVTGDHEIFSDGVRREHAHHTESDKSIACNRCIRARVRAASSYLYLHIIAVAYRPTLRGTGYNHPFRLPHMEVMSLASFCDLSLTSRYSRARTRLLTTSGVSMDDAILHELAIR